MLHKTYDVIGIAQYHFWKSKMAAMYFALCENSKFFSVTLHLKTLETTKTVLVTFQESLTGNFSI